MIYRKGQTPSFVYFVPFEIEDFDEAIERIMRDDSVYGSLRKKDLEIIFRALKVLLQSKEDLICRDGGCFIDMQNDLLACNLYYSKDGSAIMYPNDENLCRVNFRYSFRTDDIRLFDGLWDYSYPVAFKQVFTSYFSIFDNYKQYDHEIEACYLAYVLSAFIVMHNPKISPKKRDAILNQIRLYVVAAHHAHYELHKIAPIHEDKCWDHKMNVGIALLFTYGDHGTEIRLNEYNSPEIVESVDRHDFYISASRYPETDKEDRPLLMHTQYGRGGSGIYDLLGVKYHIDYTDQFLVEFVNVSIIKIFNYYKTKHESQ